MASVTVNNLNKVYADGTHAVKDLSLEIADGEFMVLVGPSGCGKTSALRMVGGLEQMSSGELKIGDRVVNHLSPRDRDIAMVFQSYALYPHMSVFENIAFPLRAQHVPRPEIKERVNRIAGLLGLEDHLGRRPRKLSGGQRQRVAMGRALVRHPQVFLMDEPLSNLDAKLRVEMRGEVTRLQRELNVTTIYVTHDQVEAMTMGDRIAVMRNGVLQQEGPPQAVYNFPKNLFVAEFIGSPPMSLFRAVPRRHDARELLVMSDGEIDLPAGYFARHPELERRLECEVACGIRPENLCEANAAGPGHATIRAEIRTVETLGPEQLVHLALPARPVVTDEVLDATRYSVSIHATDATAVCARAFARLDADSQVTVGEVAPFGLAVEKLRTFDLTTGEALASGAAIPAAPAHTNPPLPASDYVAH